MDRQSPLMPATVSAPAEPESALPPQAKPLHPGNAEAVLPVQAPAPGAVGLDLPLARLAVPLASLALPLADLTLPVADLAVPPADLALPPTGLAVPLAGAALLPGQRLARGVARALRALDFVSLDEMIPAPGLRVDLMALGPKGEVWVIECKSGRADYAADRKWQGYLEFCDRFFWAVDRDFPTQLLPEGTGLILADAYDAEIIRMGEATPLAGARRKALTQKFARQAAARLQGLRDPRL